MCSNLDINMKVKSKKQNIVTTSIGVILLAILLFLMIPLSYGIALPFVYWVNQFLFFAMLLSLTFINTKWLAPKFLFQKQYVKYYLILFTSCILIISLLKQTEILLNLSQEIKRTISERGGQQKHGGGDLSVFFYIFLIQVLVLGVNISGILIKKWQDEKNIRLQVEKDNIEMELSFLKSQINPHFLFNSLNTVNALTYIDIEQSRNALKKLGKIMRHLLSNTSSQSTTLAHEIEFINNYLEMMKMRSPKQVSIEFTVDVHLPNLKIASMLFLPFIENSFKYGVSAQAESPIIIRIEEKENSVLFYAKNKMFDRTVVNKIDEDRSYGIGIKNTQRRLELLYPGRYSLKIKKEDVFEVKLKIDLNEN